MGNGNGFQWFKNLFEGCCHLHFFLPHPPVLVSFVVCSLPMMLNSFFSLRPISLFVSRRPPVDLSAFLSLPIFNRNLRLNDSIDMFAPRFVAVIFVALLGVVKVAGLPLWPEVCPSSLHLFGCVKITGLMALSARLVSPGSGAVRTYSGLCEAR